VIKPFSPYESYVSHEIRQHEEEVADVEMPGPDSGM
jgi:hypothetical protein